MIGKPEWFKYRIFGWGLSPKTWQGFLYVGIAAFLIAMALSMSAVDKKGAWVFAILMAIFVLDVIHIMMLLPKVSDERENYHQLIIERNCSFAAIISLVGIVLYQSYNKAAIFPGVFPFDASLAIVLMAMLVTKILSHIYVNWRL